MEYNKKLVFENGREFYGFGFGADTETVHEVVYNTSMVGYQEIMSDPSSCGALVCMTYPLIGNYGLADEDYETKTPKIGGFIVREYNDTPSNFRYTKTLSQELEENGIPGITGVDTRVISKMIRREGGMKAALVSASVTKEEALKRIADTKDEHDQIKQVSCKKIWYSRTPNYKYNVVAVDCGIKHSIIGKLNVRGCNVIIVPYDTTAEKILSLRPDGVLISNGPGDPKDAQPVIELVKKLQGKLPIFGICLGHLIIALANGIDTYKMPYGHMGGNHPVKNLVTGKVEITSQNHSFAIDKKSLEGSDMKITHVDILEDTVQGLENEKDMIFSVQFHPESAPGPRDTKYLFNKFVDNMKDYKEKRGTENA